MKLLLSLSVLLMARASTAVAYTICQETLEWEDGGVALGAMLSMVRVGFEHIRFNEAVSVDFGIPVKIRAPGLVRSTMWMLAGTTVLFVSTNFPIYHLTLLVAVSPHLAPAASLQGLLRWSCAQRAHRKAVWRRHGELNRRVP